MAGVNEKRKINKSRTVRRKRTKFRRIKLLSMEKPHSGKDVCSQRISSNLKEDSEAAAPLLYKHDVVMECWNCVASCWNGSIAVIGRRREMEDALAVQLGFSTKGSKEYDFFGVYDGHGGSQVAQACSDRLHRVLAKRVEEEEGEEIHWKKVMVAGFKEMDEEVNKNGEAVATVGTTATVAVVGEEVVVVANCGDSRAVLSRGGVAVPLSDDHKPERPDELKRIEGLGGRVIDWNGLRVMGVLSTSRSIGDQYLKPFVITEPEVKVCDRTDKDEFMILATDGLWDMISNDLACQVTRRYLYGKMSSWNSRKTSGNSDRDSFDEKLNPNRAAEAAAFLTELAMAKGSRDNISVIVVDLLRPKGH